MPILTRRQTVIAIGLGTACLAGLPAVASEDRAALARAAYIWGFPLVQTRLSVKLVGQRGLSFNQLYGAPRLATPADKGAAVPNVDTIYGVAWLDLEAEPQVFSVPDTHDRYYTIQLIDAYENSFRYIGRRATGARAGHFAIAGPGWRGALPDGVAMFAAPTKTVAAVARTLVDGPGDVPAALAVQRGYSLTPLSAYPRIERPAQTLENPISLIPVFHPVDLGVAFFDELSAALVDYPPPATDHAFVRRLSALGIGPGRRPSIEADARLRAILAAAAIDADRELHRQFLDGTSEVNGWRVRYGVAEFLRDPLDRAAQNYYGLGTNISQEALYFFATQGPDGRVLDGRTRYVMTFPAAQMPPVDAFWSLSLYGLDGYLQANPIDRYSIGDRTRGLRTERDGSLQIRIQHEIPAAGTANWLPAPAGAYKLELRVYQPRATLQDGRYRIPPLVIA